MKKLLIILILSVSFPASGVDGNINGALVIKMKYETHGQANWFVTPAGTGDCTSFERACTFKTAVTKTTDGIQDTIHLGAGTHDTDDGIAGTTISKDYVSIIGIEGFKSAKLVNGNAGATDILITTGTNFLSKNIHYNNTGQADEAVVHLNIQAGPAKVDSCYFGQANGATGTGLLIDNSTVGVEVVNTKFVGLKTYGIQTNGLNTGIFENLYIMLCATGINLAGGASDDKIVMTNSFIGKSTVLGIDIDALVESTGWENINMRGNVANIDDDSVSGNAVFFRLNIASRQELIYPLTTGVTVNTGDGVWVWGTATTIIPADTVTSPFTLANINIEDYNDDQTYKIELLHGVGDNSIGIYEFTVGATRRGATSVINRAINKEVPQGDVVKIKSTSSDAGIDPLVITVSYSPTG